MTVTLSRFCVQAESTARTSDVQRYGGPSAAERAELVIGTTTTVDDRDMRSFWTITADNTFLLARTRLVRRLGRATPATMQAACQALAIAAECG